MASNGEQAAVKVGVYWDGTGLEPAVRSVYQVLDHGLRCDGCRRPLEPDQHFVYHRPEEEESFFLCGRCSGFPRG